MSFGKEISIQIQIEEIENEDGSSRFFFQSVTVGSIVSVKLDPKFETLNKKILTPKSSFSFRTSKARRNFRPTRGTSDGTQEYAVPSKTLTRTRTGKEDTCGLLCGLRSRL